MVDNLKDYLKFFIEVSEAYIKEYEDAWDNFSEYKDSPPFEALCIFLKTYAFEKAGTTATDYRDLSSKAIMQLCEEGTEFDFKLEEKAWQRFKTAANGKNSKLLANEKQKSKVPLYPDSKAKVSIIKKTAELWSEHKTLPIYLQERMETNQIREAHSWLTQIAGVGDKIASFYLRDIAHHFKINLDGKWDRDLLQPQDIWVCRSVTYLESSGNNMESSATAYHVGRYIVNESKKLSLDDKYAPECINMGMYYFGAKTKSKSKLKELMSGGVEMMKDYYQTTIRK